MALIFCKSGKLSSSLSPDEERSLEDILITTEFCFARQNVKISLESRLFDFSAIAWKYGRFQIIPRA